MYNEKIEQLISAALADGVLTEKEKQILFKKAQTMGIDLDEFEMVLDARLVKLQKAEKEKAEKSAPKSNKLGDIRKCPSCGAVLGTFQMICPECGFEFTNVGANQYVEKFSQKLQQLSETVDFGQQHGYMKMIDFGGDYEQRRRTQILEKAEARFVKNYPLPMTKEDCIEMLNFIAPKITLSGSNSTTYAYKRKYNAIIQKLEREANGNPQILDVVKTYKEQGRTNLLSSFIIWYRSLSKIARSGFWIIIVYIVFFGIGDALWSSDRKSDHKTNEKVAEYVNNGNLSEAMNLINEGADPTPLYNYYMDNNMWDEAEDYIPHKSYDVSNEEYFKYLQKSVTAMCALGKKKEAKKFIKRKVVFFEAYNAPDKSGHDEWNTTIIAKKLNAIVTNY